MSEALPSAAANDWTVSISQCPGAGVALGADRQLRGRTARRDAESSCIRSALTAQGVSVSTRIACRRLPEAVVAKVPGQEPCRNLGFFHG